MKKIIPIFLLAIILFSQGGYYLVNFIQQHLAKEAMEHQLLARTPESSMSIFDAAANKNAIIWEEEGKEFLLNGKMYDIAKIKIIDGKTYLYCVSDNTEDQVLQNRSNAVKSGLEQSPGNNFNTHTVKFQMSECTIPCRDNLLLSTAAIAGGYAPLIVSICSTIKKVNTPPPNFIQCSQNLIL